MIKIIRAAKFGRFTCDDCGCVFEATKDEVHEGFELFTMFIPPYVICPICKNHIEAMDRHWAETPENTKSMYDELCEEDT